MLRKQIIEALQQEQIFDLLIIGGGATGCGIALDAASRGLKVALVDKMDLAEGTSSRSTKLVHGGVRYLEKAITQFNRAQFELVKEGLHERGILLRNAPHLSNPIAFVTPLYSWLDVPKVIIGLKLYDWLAGKWGIGHSHLLSRKETLSRFPMVKEQKLKAGVLYYDGQFNDARMAVSLAKTAARLGAIVANHVEVTGLQKTGDKISGVKMRDNLNGAKWSIAAKGVINACGPFADALRQMDEPDCRPLMTVSSGVHIVLDKRFTPPANGLLIPETDDGRVLFILPWQEHALIGTTDDPAEIVDHPEVHEEEIAYLLRHIGRYFDLQPTRQDIKSCWSGLRPLVAPPDADDTENLVRDHSIFVSPSRLLTIVGGKWTSYRRMAEDTVDKAVALWQLPAAPCRTENLPVCGGENYSPAGTSLLEQKYRLASEICLHLNQAYGDQVELLLSLADKDPVRLHPQHPFLEVELRYALRHEFAARPLDILARRLPLALIDTQAAMQCLPRVIELMADELEWDSSRQREELELATENLQKAL